MLANFKKINLKIKKYDSDFKKTKFEIENGKVFGDAETITPAILQSFKKNKIQSDLAEVYNALQELHSENYAKRATIDSRIVPVINKMNDTTAKLVSRFRWHIKEGGVRSMYVAYRTDCMMVLPTDDPINTALGIRVQAKGKKHNKTLYDAMEAKYLEALKSGELTKRGPIILTNEEIEEIEEGDGDEVIYKTVNETLKDYWEAELQNMWTTDSRFRLDESPVAVSSDPKEFCFFYFDRDNLAKHEKEKTPYWDTYLRKIDPVMQEVFMAYIFSIFDSKHRGRQALWLYGPGFSGKSQAIKAITEYLGMQIVGVLQKGNIQTQFGVAGLYGKRLVVAPDTDNPKLLLMEKVQSMLAGDPQIIERKGKMPFADIIQPRIIVGSNSRPVVDKNKKEQTSRIIAIEVGYGPEEDRKKYIKDEVYIDEFGNQHVEHILVGDVNLKDELLREMGAFLFKCGNAYDRMTRNGSDIILDAEQIKKSQALFNTSESESYESFISEFIVVHPKAYVNKETLQTAFHAFKSNKRDSDFRYNDMLMALRKLLGVKELPEKRITIDEYGRRKRVLVGFCLHEGICSYLNGSRDSEVQHAINEIRDAWDYLNAEIKSETKPKPEETSNKRESFRDTVKKTRERIRKADEGANDLEED